MRLEQRMKLAPHMIQSMEILQLPILALQERIEQELNSNPVLELEEPAKTPESEIEQPNVNEDTKKEAAATSSDSDGIEDFSRIHNLDEDYTEYMSRSEKFYQTSQSGETDRKLEAIKNTAAAPQSLHEHLAEQWRLVDAEEAVKKAGDAIVDYIDDKGYLSVKLEQLHNKDKNEFSYNDLKKALVLVQKLEPTGVGARNLKECLLIQMAQSGEDMSFEAALISKHMDALLANRLPEIARKMNCKIEQISQAIQRMSKLDTSPGLQIGQAVNHPVTADIVVESSGNSNGFTVRLADSQSMGLKINDQYQTMSKDAKQNQKTRKFLQDNIRSAQWIIGAVEQRNRTLLKVVKSIVKYQHDFFEKGQLYLRPLPMSKVADDVGVHLATVSRAVAGKYVQCPWGLLPLRKFFSGGTENTNGQTHSWEAIRAKLQQITDEEDKAKPLSDEKIRLKLTGVGVNNISRRTIAKYRKLLNIPSARLRKKY